MALNEQKLAEHRAHRKEVLKQRKAEEKELTPKAENKLIVEKTPEGLYYLRFSVAGAPPKEL